MNTIVVAVTSALMVTCGILAYVIGFATAHWLTNGDDWTRGLWQTCDRRSLSDKHYMGQCKSNILNQPAYINASRVFLTLGLFMVKVAWSTVMGACLKGKHDRTAILRVQIGICSIGTLFSLTGVIIFWLSHLAYSAPDIGLGWSFKLTAVGSLLVLITTLLSVIDFKMSSSFAEKPSTNK